MHGTLSVQSNESPAKEPEIIDITSGIHASNSYMACLACISLLNREAQIVECERALDIYILYLLKDE